MKKELTLLVLVALSLFSTAQITNTAPRVCYADPSSPRPASHVHRATNGPVRNAPAHCDTNFIDYSTYDELICAAAGRTFHGTWNGTPAPVANELSSFVTTASAANGADYYAGVYFDSIAFADYTNNAIGHEP